MGAAGKEKRAKPVAGTKKRGGPRPNSGRPKEHKSYSDLLKKQVFAALDKQAEETGVNFGELLVLNAYDEKAGNLRMVCIKVIAEMMTVKEAVNKNINEEVAKPKIYLPEYKPITATETTTGEPVPVQTH